MIGRARHIAAAILFSVMACMAPRLALCQTAAPQPQSQTQPHPAGHEHGERHAVPLAHLYWHFLVYQNHLDTVAVAQEAQGKDGSWARNHLQTELGLTDAEYAPIRVSSARLAAEVAALDAQASALRAGTATPDVTKLKALTVQREEAIHAEIVFLKQTLPPDRMSAFEAFLVQFFAPTNSVSFALPSTSQPSTGQPAASQPAAAGTVQP
jgi:hypothetical protein